jgi:L-ascorbate metabolism protein UlaG (beta-lactamase superfamily)
MLACPRFRDGEFHNTYPVTAGLRGNPLKLLSEYAQGSDDRTPSFDLPLVSPFETWAKKSDSGLRLTWLGHSTVLVEMGGATFLTDPVFGQRASPFRFAGPKRFHATPVTLDQLPKLDAVLLSHDHYDHLCAETMRWVGRHGTPVITSLGVGAHLERLGVSPERITELDWFESHQLAGFDVRFTAAPAQHFSGRGALDRNQTAWSSWVIEDGGHRIFFSGDTGLTDEFKAIAQRFGRFDITLLEVGAHHPAWGGIHLGPDNAVRALEWLGGGPLLPVHWGTFNLALHPWDAPANRLVELLGHSPERLQTPRLGQPFEPTQLVPTNAWWNRAGR